MAAHSTNHAKDSFPVTSWKLVSALVVLAAIFVTTSVLQALIPDEMVPAREHGGTRYVLQSVDQLIEGPVFGVVCGGCLIPISIYVTKRLPRNRVPVRRSPCEKWIIRGLMSPLYAFLVWVWFLGTIWHPLTQFRTVVIRAETIQFDSLLRSWTVSRHDLESANVLWHPADKVGREGVDLIVALKDGRRFRSVALSARPDSAELASYASIFDQLKDDLRISQSPASVTTNQKSF